jgi:hypothetical protein
MRECSSSASVQGISGTASTAKQVSVKLADCNDEYPTLKSVRPLAEPGSHAEAVLEKLVTIQMLAVLVAHHRWPLFDFYRRRDAEHPARRGAYMLDPVAFRQSVARVVGTRMKDATQGAACGNNPGKPVLRSMRNGAGVGAVQGGATGFVGGEILGGEVTGGATGIPGAAPGGFVGGTFGAVKGVCIHWNFYKRGSPAAPRRHVPILGTSV